MALAFPLRVTIKGTLTAVVFPDDHVETVFVVEPADNVFITHHVGGELFAFESEAYHLPDWCEQNGFTLAEKEVEFADYVEPSVFLP